MKRIAAGVLLVVVGAAAVFCDFAQLMEEADRLNKEIRHDEVEELLLKALNSAGSNRERAEVYWRLSRALMYQGDEADKNAAPKDTILSIFAEGEQYGQKAIELDPSNYLGYFWKSGNIGRWGQTKGILNSLFKAPEMRDLLVKAVTIKPDHADSYYLLGQLYEQVPRLISFGNVDFAVSLGRKAVDMREAQYQSGVEKELNYDYYTELAKHLYARGWSSSKRMKQHDRKKRDFESETELMEKSFRYEGSIVIEGMDDRNEAIELARWAVRELEALPKRDTDQEDDLKEVKDLLAEWGQ